MKFIKDQQIEKNKWIELLNKSLQSSVFQTPEYYHFFNDVEGYSANVFAIEEDDEYKCLAVITIQKEGKIKGYFSRRGIIYGGPIILENDNEYLTILLKKINKFYKNKLIYIESRNYFDFSLYHEQFINSRFSYIPWLNYRNNCENLENMKKSMSKSRLRQIKKAIGNGAETHEAKCIDDVNSFYEILRNLYKNKIKKPLFSLHFFQELYKSNLGKYLLIKYENKIIGGIICIIKDKKSIYEFYIAGLDTEYKELHPSIMATWAGMEYGYMNGIPVFDFMGAGEPDRDYGVREFKSRFGGELVEFGRYINILNPLLYKIGVLFLKLKKKLSK